MIRIYAICGILVHSASFAPSHTLQKVMRWLTMSGDTSVHVIIIFWAIFSCHNQVALCWEWSVKIKESWCPEASPHRHCYVSACCHRIAKYLQSTAFTLPMLSGVNCKLLNEWIAAGWGSGLVSTIHNPPQKAPQLCFQTDQEGKGIC